MLTVFRNTKVEHLLVQVIQIDGWSRLKNALDKCVKSNLMDDLD